MKREYSAEHADACSAVLGQDAEVVLERELSDPSNFGMAKSLFMAGSEMGFDMSSQEGVDRYAHLNATVARMAMPHASRPAFLPAARVRLGGRARP